MAIEFATDAWIKAVRDEVNRSEAYQRAAKTWEGDFYFVLEAGEGYPQERYMYIDLWHGEARDAYQVEDPSAQAPAFQIRAPLSVWRDVLNKKLDPIRGLASGKLKLKGNLMKIIKVPKAATALVACAADVDTEWPA